MLLGAPWAGRLALYAIMVTVMGCSNAGPAPVVPVGTDQLRADVLALSSITPARNYRNIDSLERAADYIRTRLTSMGYGVVEQKFTAYHHEYKNIIASHGPEDAPRLVIGAHYDVYEDQPGADDNGSGVAALLALADLLRRPSTKLACRVELVAYALEELPTFRSEQMGSFIHARSLAESRVPVLGMVSLEMVGFYTDQPGSQTYPLPVMKLFYPARGNFVAVVGNFRSRRLVHHFYRHMGRGPIDVQRVIAPAFVTGVDFSDHLNYWKFGYPALMVTDTSFYRNPHYHRVSDTVDTLDFERLAQVVGALHLAASGFTSSR